MNQSAVLTGEKHKLTSPSVPSLISVQPPGTADHSLLCLGHSSTLIVPSRLYLQLDKVFLESKDWVLDYSPPALAAVPGVQSFADLSNVCRRMFWTQMLGTQR